MKKNPPHLPAKSCSVPLHRRVETLFQFSAMIVIAFVTGIAATLVTVAWIAPVYTPNTVIYSIDANNRGEEDRVIDPLFVRQQEKQIVHVYDRREKIDNQFYGDAAYVAPGVFLTSDGWLALYHPSYVSGSERYWEVIDYKGSVYTPETAVFDPFKGIVYVNITGDGFFAGSFAAEEDIERLAFSWAVYGGDWQPALLGTQKGLDHAETFSIWEPQAAKTIESETSAASILLGEDGRFVGFASGDGTVISSFFVELQYTTVFEGQSVEYRAVPWTGYMVSASVADGMLRNTDGFYIIRSGSRPNAASVGAGDVVIRIEGRSVDEKTLAREILTAPEAFTATVLRDGQELDILVSKERIRVF